MILRKGNAGSNTAVDHIEVTKAALAQLPSTDPDAAELAETALTGLLQDKQYAPTKQRPFPHRRL